MRAAWSDAVRTRQARLPVLPHQVAAAGGAGRRHGPCAAGGADRGATPELLQRDVALVSGIQ
jgi:hypothetical protein